MPQSGDSNNGKNTQDRRSSGGDGRQTQGNIIDTSLMKNTSFDDRSSGFGTEDGGQTQKNEIDTFGVKSTSYVDKPSGAGDGGSGGGK
jgi:hypothetical protein